MWAQEVSQGSWMVKDELGQCEAVEGKTSKEFRKGISQSTEVLDKML